MAVLQPRRCIVHKCKLWREILSHSNKL